MSFHLLVRCSLKGISSLRVTSRGRPDPTASFEEHDSLLISCLRVLGFDSLRVSDSLPVNDFERSFGGIE